MYHDLLNIICLTTDNKVIGPGHCRIKCLKSWPKTKLSSFSVDFLGYIGHSDRNLSEIIASE